jgi:two-component system NtrC family sensor kinase
VLYSTRTRLMASLIGVVLAVGGVSLWVGGQLLYRAVLNEAGSRVRQDLNAARMMHDDRVRGMATSLQLAAADEGFAEAVRQETAAGLQARLARLARLAELDYAALVLPDNRRVSAADGNWTDDDPGERHPLAAEVLRTGSPAAGTLVLSADRLAREDAALARRAVIDWQPGESAGAPGAVREGLCLAAAIPLDLGAGIAVLYGGILLNRNEALVDKVAEAVFQQASYAGRDLGTTTIFLGDRRVATTVRDTAGQRALGTSASAEVTRRVLGEGQRWTDRAFVVRDWYVTAYQPITDIAGRRVGMLYVGVLEAKYTDMRRRAVAVFSAITLAGMLLAGVTGAFLANRIVQPVNRLIAASTAVSRGDFAPSIGPVLASDIGVLQQKFQEMLEALRERELRQREESEQRLIASERQASVGRLAAGVAHEINNPMTAVMTFTHLLLRRTDLPAEVRPDLELIAGQAERVRRIVKGLLDFSRQTAIRPESTDLNALAADTVKLLGNQALVKGVHLGLTADGGIPILTLDRSQIQSVLVNLILNALDAVCRGGWIEVATRQVAGGPPAVELEVADNGCGIAAADQARLFDPFFTTKEVGQGTGLGLAVSAGIVARHGGQIQVRSQPGQGSRFTVRLPVMERAADRISDKECHCVEDGTAGGRVLTP